MVNTLVGPSLQNVSCGAKECSLLSTPQVDSRRLGEISIDTVVAKGNVWFADLVSYILEPLDPVS